MAYTPLQKLSNRHYKAVELLVFTSKTQQEIADEIGITRQTLTWWEKDPLFLEEQKKQMTKKFEQMARKAQKIMEDLAENAQSETVRMNAAKDILSRSGWDPTSKTEVSTPQGFSISIDYGDSDEG